jgi:DNA-binding transcriptional LysR family regulator
MPALEKSLGLALFTRSRTGFLPTEAAQSLRMYAESLQAIAQRDAEIVRILPRLVALPLETWITMHQDLRNSPRCRVTFDALVEGLERYVDSNRG